MTSTSHALDESVADQFQRYDGKPVGEIKFVGLVRSKEQALKWLMKTKQGASFSSKQLAQDIQVLYNTGNLYDIVAVINENQDGSLVVTIRLEDKWTLLPFVGAQGGGGSLTVGGGLYDTNLFGYFITGVFNGYVYNGAYSYDANVSQEYIAGSETMGMVDWSDTINPSVIHNIDGSAAGQFVWERRQQEVMLGTHLAGPARLMIFGDYYNDFLLSASGVTASVFQGPQYRIRPQAIFGRVNWLNYLEDGHEFLVNPGFSNFLGVGQPYQSLMISYKEVKIWPHSANFAYIVAGGAMSPTPPPYEFIIGGYYNVRGFIDNRQIGHFMSRASVEYRPLLFEEKIPFFFDVGRAVVQGCLFSDAGSAWGDSGLTGDLGSEQFRLLWSAGAGIRANFLHFAGAVVRLDVARTVKPDEGWGISFGVGQFF